MMSKKATVDQFMQCYNQLINETIKQHNAKIYGNLRDFLLTNKNKLFMAAARTQQQRSSKLKSLAQNVQKEQASQVPTCFVITNSESASSIDTQFDAMEAELEKEVKAINIQLDEKKCATMKSCIELIQMKLRAILGLDVTGSLDDEIKEVPREKKIKLELDEYSEDDNDSDNDDSE